MKNLFVVLLLIIVIILSNLNAQSANDSNSNDILNDSKIHYTNSVLLDTLVYEVFGMDCPGCHSVLEKQINKLTAVDDSKADWVKQEVRIVVKKDSIVDEDELFKKIKKANFTPGERKID